MQKCLKTSHGKYTVMRNFKNMKKLKLKAIELGVTELLTTEQWKNVMGGDGSGGDLYQCCKIGSIVGQKNSCSGCTSTINKCPTGYQRLFC